MEVREIKPANPQDNQDKPKTLLEEMKELREFKEEMTAGKVKKKKIKVPRKAKVKKRKLKKGYIGILYVDENGNISGEKQKIEGSSFKDKKGLYHATEGEEILYFDGKFPVIIQPSWSNNPINIRDLKSKNETYGQPYIMAKMLKDTIKSKSKGGNIIIWIIIAAAVILGINYFAGGSLFGGGG